MRKFISTILMTIVLGIMVPVLANTTNAQTRDVTLNGRVVQVYKKRSFYQRHRNKINVALGAGAGAIIGGLIGGRRGVGIGLLAGGAGSALGTYKLRNRNQRRY